MVGCGCSEFLGSWTADFSSPNPQRFAGLQALREAATLFFRNPERFQCLVTVSQSSNVFDVLLQVTSRDKIRDIFAVI